MGRELWLFTMRFPYGSGETFLETELPILCARFDRVRVIPLFVEGRPRPMPANATAHEVITDPYAPAGLSALFAHWTTWRHVRGIIRRSAPSKEVFQRQWPTLRSKLRQALRRALIVRDGLFREFDPGRAVLYSFWTADWATVLGLLKLWDPRVRFVSRMLGFDLFTFRSPDGWPAFRTFHLAQADRVFIISQAGMDHMKEHYPDHAGKYVLSRLATSDHGAGPWSPSATLRLVSCSNLVPLKRVHLIVEALMRVNVPVAWTHFGDGDERAAIQEKIALLPANVRAELMGHRSNAEVIAWYRSNAVDLFLHMSSTEGGVPVALQEAASFGIPLLAADAGGVKEIVNEATGVLLAVDPDPGSIARHLGEHRSSVRNTSAFRVGVRAWWSDHCRAEEVYGRFCDRLIGPSGDRAIG